MRTIETVRFSISGTAAQALPIDSVAEWFDDPRSTVSDKRFDYTLKRVGKGYRFAVTCSPEVARYLLRDLHQRGLPTRESGYDQPESWCAPCRKAAAAIRAALEPAAR